MGSMLIRERLIERRLTMGITKQEAAKRMNMSQPAYLRYESGERAPSIHVIQTMATVLGTSVEYLIGNSENPLSVSYVINKDTDSELFDLITEYKTTSAENREKMMKYINLLISSEKDSDDNH